MDRRGRERDGYIEMEKNRGGGIVIELGEECEREGG